MVDVVVDDVDVVDSVDDDVAEDMASETGPTRATSPGHCHAAVHRPPPQHASQSLADIARHVKECHESQQPKIPHIFDDVASNICLALPHRRINAIRANEHIRHHRAGSPRGAVA